MVDFALFRKVLKRQISRFFPGNGFVNNINKPTLDRKYSTHPFARAKAWILTNMP